MWRKETCAIMCGDEHAQLCGENEHAQLCGENEHAQSCGEMNIHNYV